MWVGHSCPTPLTLLLTLEHGELANYYLAHSTRADMYRRLGRTAEARASYEKALARPNRNQSGNSCKSGFGS
jgi:predicted RNA polymerase sigma factor